jgi:hypothetical protein
MAGIWRLKFEKGVASNQPVIIDRLVPIAACRV